MAEITQTIKVEKNQVITILKEHLGIDILTPCKLVFTQKPVTGSVRNEMNPDLLRIEFTQNL
ncbi:MAG: hypothetical protein ACWA5P_01715 [bacterium]